MIHLLPNENRLAPLECELFDYDLSAKHDERHLYEALSYTWGTENKLQSIIVNGCTFPVTANLHAALLHLRNHRLQRTLWVDAICIDQDMSAEKSKQVPLMRMIYAQAQQVVVWLGEAIEDGDKAIERIRCLAEGQNGPSDQEMVENQDTCCRRLLQRDWFERVLVLQEVGVARCICILCGPVQINGHTFSEGVSKLRLPSSVKIRVNPVVFLMKGALYRPKYHMDSSETVPIGELIGMYQNHKATKQHDKVYALLGLSNTTALAPNYDLSWAEVFRLVANYTFPECSVENRNETDTAIIKGKGWVLGYIHSVKEDASKPGLQTFKVLFNGVAQLMGFQDTWDTDWVFQGPGELIQDADIICLLQGALKPSVVRARKDHFTIITASITPRQLQRGQIPNNIAPRGHSTEGLQEIFLTWTVSSITSERKDGPEVALGIGAVRSGFQENHCGNQNGTDRDISDPFNVASKGVEFPEMGIIHFFGHSVTQAVLCLSAVTPHYQEEHSAYEERKNEIAWIMAELVVRVSQEVKFPRKAVENALRQAGTEDAIVGTLVNTAVVDRPSSADKIEQILLKHEKGFPISEQLVCAISENQGPLAYIAMQLLLQQQGDLLPISSKVVENAASNNGDIGVLLLAILIRHRAGSLPITTEAFKKAAANTGPKGHRILALLFLIPGSRLMVSPDVISMAVRNTGPHGEEIVYFLAQHLGKDFSVTEQIVRLAAGNPGPCGDGIMKVLIQSQGEGLSISEEVVRTVAENPGACSLKIMHLLAEHLGDTLPVSQEAIKATIRHTGEQAPALTKFLLKHLGKNFPISEEVMKTAAMNTSNEALVLFEILIQHQAKEVPGSQDLVMAAAGNASYGTSMILALIQHKKDTIVAEEAIQMMRSGATRMQWTELVTIQTMRVSRYTQMMVDGLKKL